MKFQPITREDERLIGAAVEILEKRYHLSRHTVAAAVLCDSGQIYTGINVEAVGYGPCAEPIAIGTAFTNGDWSIEAIVAVSKNGVLSPCGNCRQLIFDYAPDAMVILKDGGKTVKTQARNLLPGHYSSNFGESS